MTTSCRGIRGATTADANTSEAILQATRELLLLLIEANDLDSQDIAGALLAQDIDETDCGFTGLVEITDASGWKNEQIWADNKLAPVTDWPGFERTRA